MAVDCSDTLPDALSDSGMAASASSWSNTPPDILGKILDSLPVADCIRFGGICVSWHQALPYRGSGQAPPYSWLILSCDSHKLTVRCHSLSEKRDYVLHLPDISVSHEHNYIMSSTKGWLHSLKSDYYKSEIHMFHPISRRQLRFPSIDTLLGITLPEEFRLTVNPNLIKVVLLPYQPASSTSSFLAAAITPGWFTRILALSIDGDKSWTTIKAPSYYHFIDVIFFEGNLYALSWFGELVFCDISDVSNPRVTHTVQRPLNLSLFNCYKCLVESSGDLLMVWRELSEQPKERGGYDTTNIYIFKMDFAEKKWVELKTLGDHAILLGYSYSHNLSVSTKDVPELRRDCIYLFDKMRSSFKLRAYHIRYQSFVPLPLQWRLKGKFTPPVWFTPTIS